MAPAVFLLDGFELRMGADAVALPRGSQRVLAFLALRDRPVLRGFVSGVLWGDASEEQASGSLRSAIWRVHRTGINVVRSTSTHVWLDPAVRIDLRNATTLAHALLDSAILWDPPYGADRHLRADVLPDWYEDWAVNERERFRQLRLHALEALSGRLAESHRFAEAAQAGVAAVACDPLRESAHRALVGVHLANRNLTEALRQYRRYAKMLDEELGLAPSSSFRAMVRTALGDVISL